MISGNILLFALTTILLIGFASADIDKPLVRRVADVPEGHYAWALSQAGTDIYAIDIIGNRYDLRHRPSPRNLRDWEASNFVMRVDSQAEKVVDTFVIDADFWPIDSPLLISLRKGTDPHLVSNYNHWVSDPSRGIVYALKPFTGHRMTLDRWREIYVVEARTGNVLHTIRMPEGFIDCIMLSPDGQLLAVAHAQQIHLYRVADIQLIVTLPFSGDASIQRMVFSADGKRLFVFGKARGVLVVDVERKQFDLGSDEAARGRMVTFGLPDLQMRDMRLSPDGKEIYIALTQLAWEKDNDRYLNGRVAAIDTGSWKVVRTLRLSDTGCFSLAVVGNKLFAACLDGIYVIDIDAWRKKPNYQPPWVKLEGK